MVADRFDLVRKMGEEFTVACTDCGADHSYHVDEFTAVRNYVYNRNLLIIFGALSVILGLGYLVFAVMDGVIFWLIEVLLFVGPWIILVVVLKFENDSQSQFNRVKLKGHVHNSKLTSTSAKTNISKVDNVQSMTGAIKKFNKENLPSNKKEDK